MPISPITIPQGNTVLPLSQGGTQLPGGGGTFINFSPNTVYIVPTQAQLGQMADAFPLVQGTALPWPNQTAYAWVAEHEVGNIYSSPIQSSILPVPTTVTIGGQPIDTAAADGDTSGDIVRVATLGGTEQNFPFVNLHPNTRSIDIGVVLYATGGAFSPVWFGLIGNTSGVPYVVGMFNYNLGWPVNISKSFPRGANYGDRVLNFVSGELGATITTFNFSVVCSISSTESV